MNANATDPEAPQAAPGPPPPPPPGPIAQSVAIGFRAVYVAMLLALVLWLGSNVREIAPDTQAVVLRFGRIVAAQQAGLLLTWPRPISEVRLLPGPDRQLSQDVSVLQPESDKAAALFSATDPAQALPKNAAPYYTGDRNLVLLNATLIYRISDPVAFALSESHVPAALDRLFRATAVRVAAGRNLNDFLVVQTAGGPRNGAGAGDQVSDQVITALRSEVRSSLLDSMNARLAQLAVVGTSLGVEIERIDTTAWLPPEAKAAFDSVLVATQAADRGVAVARTDAERRRQGAAREQGRLLSAAQATAKESISAANVDTAGIRALEHEATPLTRGSLLERVYRADVADIMNRTGRVTLVDAQGGTRLILPGKQK